MTSAHDGRSGRALALAAPAGAGSSEEMGLETSLASVEDILLQLQIRSGGCGHGERHHARARAGCPKHNRNPAPATSSPIARKVAPARCCSAGKWLKYPPTTAH